MRLNHSTEVRTFRGNGEDQDGSFRALKILNEASSEAFEQLPTNFVISAFLTSQHLSAKAFKRDLFCLVMYPRAEISTEK